MKDYRSEVLPGAPIDPKDLLVPTNKALVWKATGAASWSWLLAVVSAFNLLFAYMHAPVRLVLGLISVEIIYFDATRVHWASSIVDTCAISGVLGLVVALGFGAKAMKTWAIALLFILFASDTVILAGC